MALTSKVTQKGGHKIKALLKNAKKNRSRSIKVGFFGNSKYEDGTPVAAAAAANEFGAGATPERPFFRRSIRQLQERLPEKAKSIINPRTMSVDPMAAREIANFAVDIIQGEIKALDKPPNAPSTLKGKHGSSPLEDSKKMLNSVRHNA